MTGAAASEPTRQLRTQSAEALAERIAAIASDKKAIDIGVLDLRDVVGYTDFFVICSGNTERQTKAIHDGDLPGAEGRAGPAPAARRGRARRRAGS